MSKVPLINYAVIEWHPVDQVLRQFNYVQPITRQPENLDSLHRLTRQGKTNINWRSHHSTWVMQWADRYNRRPVCQPIETYSVTYDYFDWYLANGKPHILTPVERQRVLHARPQNQPPTRRAHPATPRRRRGNNTGASSSAPPQPQPPVADLSTPIAQPAFSAFQHMGSPSEGFFSNIVHPGMPIYGTPTPTPLRPPLSFATDSNFPIIAHTPPHSLFYTVGPIGTGAGSSHARRTATPEDDETDESTEEEEELVPRRNPYRTRHPPGCDEIFNFSWNSLSAGSEFALNANHYNFSTLACHVGQKPVNSLPVRGEFATLAPLGVIFLNNWVWGLFF
ncbi:hypothetical protein GQ457_12G028970 [Hibiscus cannabinus]